jgi:hypothetical protein
MNKKLKSLICLMLSSVTVFAVACKGNINTSESSQSDSSSTNSSSSIDKVEETSNMIIANNKSAYKILLADDAEINEEKAAAELSYFLYEATGVLIPIVYEAQVDTNGKYISLGNTDVLEAANLEGSYEELGAEGYRIKTVDDDICIYAANSRGIINGVYGYLDLTLNYEFYYDEVYDIDKVTSLSLHDMDVKDVPDIESRIAGYGYIAYNSKTLQRMQMQGFEDSFAGPTYHNCFHVLPPDTYKEEHPSWYALHATVTQLCYTARGNQTELAQMQETVASVMFDWLQEYPERNMVQLGLSDDHNWCGCSTCASEKEKYGEYSGAVIKFFNKTSELLKAKLQAANDPRVDRFRISFFAYFDLENPPVVLSKDAKGNYQYDNEGNVLCTYAPEMKLDEHIVPFFAPYYADYTQDFYSVANQKYLDNLIAWSAISKNVIVWTYDQYFSDSGFMVPYNAFSAMQSVFKALKECDTSWLFVQGQMQNKTPTAFCRFKGYLAAKYGWNVDEDYNTMKNNFFKAMYGKQSDVVLSVFEEMCLIMYRYNSELGGSAVIGSQGHMSDRVWAQNVLVKWISQMDSAVQALVEVGDEKSAENVKIDTLGILYTMLYLYGSSVPETEYVYYKTLFIDYLDGVNLTHISEGDLLTEFLKILH